MPLLVCLAILALAAEPAQAAERPTGWKGIGAPLLNYNSDLGLGLGAVGALVDHGDGTVQPYRTYLAGQVLVTTRGVQSHQLWLDALGIGGTSLRLQGMAMYYEDRFANWFGPEHTATEDLALVQQNKRYYQYRLREVPALRLALGIPLAQRLVLKPGWRFKRVIADAYPGTLADARPPRGLGASFASEATLALVWDGRDREFEPTRGILAELFARAALRAWGSSYPYRGVTLSLRGYQRVSERVVLAARLLGDLLAGAPPFWELVQLGGSDRLMGLGGAYSVRGVRQGRFVGKAKLVANFEARTHVARFALWGTPVDLSAVGFVDAGRAFAELDAHRPLPGLALGLGGGVRLGWNETLILRLDAAVPIGDRGYGAYLQIHQMF